MTNALRLSVTCRQPPRQLALVAMASFFIASLGSIAPAWGQRSVGGKALPLIIEVDFHELMRANVSPLLWTLWSYVAAESRVTESQGFGVSVVPHFGRADISTAARWAGWATVGGAAGVLATYAPSLQHPYLPAEALFVAGYGAVAGVVAGELVWQGFRDDTPRTSSARALAIEVTVAAVRIEYVSTPIDLPTVTYAWVPALVGKW